MSQFVSQQSSQSEKAEPALPPRRRWSRVWAELTMPVVSQLVELSVFFFAAAALGAGLLRMR